MLILETHIGNDYERGLDHGRKFRHVIQSNVHSWAFRHRFQGSDEKMEETIAPLRRVAEARSPELFDELKGIAEGSQVEYRWIELLQFRIWNRLRKSPFQPHACTGVGLATKDRGAIVSGTLDDPRACYVLACSRPTDARAHIQIRWAGATWGHNGVNECGLGIAQQSNAGFERDVPYDPAADALFSITVDHLLKKCDTVKDVLDFLQDWPDRENLIVGDRTGALAEICSWGQHHFTRGPDRLNMVWNSNNIHHPDAVALGHRHGTVPKSSDYYKTRFDFLARFAEEHNGALTSEDAEQVVRSVEGFPNSVCNENTAMASIAPVQHEPGAIYIADKPVSRTEFVRYSL